MVLQIFCGSDGKESACNAGDPGMIPGSGRSPEEGNVYSFQYSCLENSMDRGDWWVTVYEVANSRTQLNTNTILCNILNVKTVSKIYFDFCQPANYYWNTPQIFIDIFLGGVTLHDLSDFSFPTKDWTWCWQWKSEILTPRPPENSIIELFKVSVPNTTSFLPKHTYKALDL